MSGADIDPVALPDLVNRLAQEVAQAQRALAAAQQKLGTVTRSLEGRTQELAEARAALALLLATLDTSDDGILAMGSFGRAMHFNERFIELWGIPRDKLQGLNDAALLAMQLSQVKDPERFLANAQARKARPDEPRFSIVEMTDGRILQCRVVPHRLGGKRVGTVTIYQDVTERERMGRMLSALEADLPQAVARARAAVE